MRRILTSIGVATILVCLGQGCPGPQGGGSSADNGATVKTAGMRFSPPSVTIKAGQTVHWDNDDQHTHTVTSGNPEDADAGQLFDSGPIPPGGTYEYQFDQPGTYRYFCDFHEDVMRDATVIVE